MSGNEIDGMICFFCKSHLKCDAKVCFSCNALVIYGATHEELTSSFKEAFGITIVISLLFVMFLPSWLSDHVSGDIIKLFHTWWMIVGCLVISLWAGFRARSATERSFEGQIRFSRRM
ncbi:hypothetical protein G3489_19370 [Shewanella baltica]|uniref:hypothetical protein n=1 Tax=Shewanella baltica TaxID=62322 RepID=UPI00217DECC8|nr:hypothetical protein [Shewanella baltica]MCS6271837.1 hypothetical protein [Shewanella baltica]